MKILFVCIATSLLISCGSNNHIIENVISEEVATTYANTITAQELKEHLYIFASDEFEGRLTGEPGQKKAAEFLKNYYISKNIKSPLGENDYFQEIPTENLKSYLKDSENVLAYIKGNEFPEEVIVISAHYDHIGMKNGEIYNGADDNGSGNVAIMEIADAFKQAVENGNGSKRSILFLHVTGEENGLLGSKFYANHPVFPINKTIANLNIDMIGRVDDEHKNDKNYVYLIGTNFLSDDLHYISESVNQKFTKLNLDYTYNSIDDPNRYYFRSDHYHFAKNNIPVIFYFNGIHQDYHRPSDTPDKIDYDLLVKRAQLIFYTTWELANRTERIKLNE